MPAQQRRRREEGAVLLDAFRLTDKVAVVTGGGRGIGRGCALAFAEMGAHVVVGARTREQLDETCELARAHGVETLAVECDVMDADQRQSLVDEAVGRFGRLDILVNNAGGSQPKPPLETSERMFNRAFAFNVTTAFEMTKLAAPHMLKGEGGSIVNISSAAGRIVQPGFAAYGTAKAAMTALTRLLSADFAPDIRVNAIEVGATLTDSLAPYLDGELKKAMEDRTPMKSLGTVEDIAIAALYLASPAARWVTGRVLAVDGGTESTNWPFEMK